MYSWLTFVAGFSVYATETGAVLGDGAYKDEVCDLRKFNDGMKNFRGLEGLLIETKPYVDALDRIDREWPSNFFTSEDKTRVQYSVELMKVREFTERLQCSQAKLAYAYTMFLAGSTDPAVDWKNDMGPKVIDVSDAVGNTVPKIMAVLSHLEITPPKWMVMTSMFAYGIKQKAKGDEGYFKNVLLPYLRDTAGRIASELVAFDASCRDYLQDADPAKTMEHRDIINRLHALAISIDQAQGKESSLLDHASFTSFEFEQWMLMDVGETENKLNVFMPVNDELKELNISWDKLRTRIVSKFDEIKSYSEQNTSWMLEMYETKLSTQDNVQFLLKNVYLTVVLRYTLMMVTYCDNMKVQLMQSPKWSRENNIMRPKWKIMCEPIIDVVTEAIKFLGGDTALEELLPVINTFVNVFGEETSSIIIKVMSMLNRLSGMLGMKANSHIEPLSTVKSDKMSYILQKDFPMAQRAFERAVQYTRNIEKTFPHINFKVIDFIINSV